MIFPKKCLGCPPFLGYICWPKVVGALLLLSAPFALFSFRRPWQVLLKIASNLIEICCASVPVRASLVSCLHFRAVVVAVVAVPEREDKLFLAQILSISANRMPLLPALVF